MLGSKLKHIRKLSHWIRKWPSHQRPWYCASSVRLFTSDGNPIPGNSVFLLRWNQISRPFDIHGPFTDTQNRGLRMRWECWERFPHHRLQKKPLISHLGMYHATCVTHVSWWMLGSLNRGGGENVPGIPGACATRKSTYLARSPCIQLSWCHAALNIACHIDGTMQRRLTQLRYQWRYASVSLSRNQILFTDVFADVLGPDGARPSAHPKHWV